MRSPITCTQKELLLLKGLLVETFQTYLKWSPMAQYNSKLWISTWEPKKRKKNTYEKHWDTPKHYYIPFLPGTFCMMHSLQKWSFLVTHFCNPTPLYESAEEIIFQTIFRQNHVRCIQNAWKVQTRSESSTPKVCPEYPSSLSVIYGNGVSHWKTIILINRTHMFSQIGQCAPLHSNKFTRGNLSHPNVSLIFFCMFKSKLILF